MDHITVQDVRIPALGFGTWQLTGSQSREAVRHALELGYRHIDTARIYRNEAEVGQGIRDSGVDRDEIFLVTKIPPESADRRGVERETAASLRDLQMDHVDLLLLHWPTDDVPLDETLSTMDQMRNDGRTRHIGVSNFSPELLTEAVGLAPVVANQVKYHPGRDRSELTGAAQRLDVTITAYSPLKAGVLDQPVLREIGQAHGKTPAQVALRWLLQQPNVGTIPRSSSAAHREQNLDVFDFTLSDDEMARIFAI